MRRGVKIAFCLILGLSLLGVGTAQAEPSRDEQRAEARRLLEEGFAADEAGAKDKARRLYLESFSIYASYDVAGNLGLIEFSLERYAEAANHLSYCLRHFPSAESLELKQLIEQKLTVARQYSVTLTLEVSERDAAILLDGEPVGTSPLASELYVTPGIHTLGIRKGDRSAEQTFEAKGGETQTLRLALPAKLAAYRGEYEGGSGTGPSWTPAYVLGGVTIASFVTSMVTRGLAGAKADQISKVDAGTAGECGGANAGADCGRLEELSAQHDSLAMASNVTLVAAGVGLAATAGYVSYVLLRKKQSAVQATGFYDGSAGGVLLRGMF